MRIPTKKELVARRAFDISRLNPILNDWGGWLGQDSKGIFVYELKYVPYILEPQKGVKIYLEEYYANLEKRILDTYNKAKKLIKKLESTTGKNALDIVLHLLQLEATLIVLHRYHETPPTNECFLTEVRLEEILINETSPLHYAQYLMTINTNRISTPLAVGVALKKIFKESLQIKNMVSLSTFTAEDRDYNNPYVC